MLMFVGIDPGVGGGIVAVAGNGIPVAVAKMPETDRDLLDLMRQFAGARAVLERVHAMPKQGVASTFTFGCGYGRLRMALTAAEIPFEEVTPQSWQKVMGCLSRGDKNVTKAKAQQLFPSVKVTHAVADALLIAEFARRTYHARSAAGF